MTTADTINTAIRKLNHWSDKQPKGLRRSLARLVDFPVRAAWHVWRNRQYLSALKLINMGVVYSEYLFRRKRLWGRPIDVKIEPTNICNTTCQLCPTGLGMIGRKKGRMTLDQFQRVVDQIRRYAYTVDLSNWGDPLICPDIVAMIRYAHNARLWTYLSSNLHAMTDDLVDDLVTSGLDMLNCSLHAATAETYQAYQPNRSFDAIVSAVQKIESAKKRLNRRTPVIRLCFVVTAKNEHEIDAFQSLARQLGVESVIMAASLNVRFIGQGKHLENLHWTSQQRSDAQNELMQQWLPKQSQWIAPWYRRIDAAMHATPGRKLYRCDWPWKRMVVNWDGDVTVCCGVFDASRSMGNVFSQSISSIWNDAAYQHARQAFRKAVPDGIDESCHTCCGVLI